MHLANFNFPSQKKQNRLCKSFYAGMDQLTPFPKFPVELHVDEEPPVVCYNNTHGLYGWCGTLSKVRLGQFFSS